MTLDRDVNAARNMLIRAGFTPADADDCKAQGRDAPGQFESEIPHL